jgi:hypothetical protein
MGSSDSSMGVGDRPRQERGRPLTDVTFAPARTAEVQRTIGVVAFLLGGMAATQQDPAERSASCNVADSGSGRGWPLLCSPSQPYDSGRERCGA